MAFLVYVILAHVATAQAMQAVGCPAMPHLPMNPATSTVAIPDAIKQKLITYLLPVRVPTLQAVSDRHQ
jgi:hypothetical protein